MTDLELTTGTQIKLKQGLIAEYLVKIDNDTFTAADLAAIYDLLGTSGYTDLKASLTSDLETENTDLQTEFDAL